jgi:hypothetical protein
MQGVVDVAIRRERDFMIEKLLPEMICELREEAKTEVVAAIKRAFEEGTTEARAVSTACAKRSKHWQRFHPQP